MPRIIFHIDVNSAFLSWTAVKMVREGKPDIRLVPSVVSGDPSDRRSIITAASIPAKKLGIKTAQPVSMALRTYPQLVIVGGDWTWYKACYRSPFLIHSDHHFGLRNGDFGGLAGFKLRQTTVFGLVQQKTVV